MIPKDMHPMVLAPIKELFFRFTSFAGIQSRTVPAKIIVPSEFHVDLLLTIKHDSEIKKTVVGLLSLDQHDRVSVIDHLINHTEMNAAPPEFKELFMIFKDSTTAVRTLQFLTNSL